MSQKTIEREIDTLQQLLRQLQVDYNRFFAGDLPRPPSELHDRIHYRLKRLRDTKLPNAVDRFRVSNLEARYNTYSEMFGRRVRDVEEGRVAPAARATPAPRFDVERGVVIESGAPSAAAEALFRGLSSRTGSALNMDADSFRSYLDNQVTAIQQKTGCSSVQFRLVSQDGKVKLKAKPLGAKTKG